MASISEKAISILAGDLNSGRKGQLISKENYDVFDSAKKKTKLIQVTILGVLHSFLEESRTYCFYLILNGNRRGRSL